MGEWFTYATIWFSLIAYAASTVISSVMPGRHGISLAGFLWTLGCLACLVHVGLAFHVYHGWSHAAAYADTARQTQETVGLNWGGGIFFNYAFLLVWIADTVWWWVRPASYRQRPGWITALIHAFFLFMIFNATVPFGSQTGRWCGLALFIVVVLSLAWRFFRNVWSLPLGKG